ncbi:MAG: GYD domain-containing protein [Cucumibacter sp.]
MARYIVLMNWTEQGIKTVKDSPKRLKKAREMGKKYGVTIDEFYLTIGAHDMVVLMTARDDTGMAKFLLAQGMGGNIRTVSLKAFEESAYRKIMAGV